MILLVMRLRFSFLLRFCLCLVKKEKGQISFLFRPCHKKERPHKRMDNKNTLCEEKSRLQHAKSNLQKICQSKISKQHERMRANRLLEQQNIQVRAHTKLGTKVAIWTGYADCGIPCSFIKANVSHLTLDNNIMK